ncbi:hypothetical protein BS78_03G420100 [Paspalum vaginatum]|nr:hypothetical protein BS78_03G420100 [Paspalum vaginatum]
MLCKQVHSFVFVVPSNYGVNFTLPFVQPIALLDEFYGEKKFLTHVLPIYPRIDVAIGGAINIQSKFD